MFFSYQCGILVEDLLSCRSSERVGERRQKGAGGKFQMEDDGGGVGRLDLVDHDVVAFARAQDTLAAER